MQSDAPCHYRGSHGICFSIFRYVITSKTRERLQILQLPVPAKARYKTCRLLTDVYDRMQAGDRDCNVTIAVSAPLTREQADTLNAQRVTVAKLVGGAAASVTHVSGVAGVIARLAVGYGVGRIVGNNLPTFHSGDVVLSIDLSVQGGIGPQRSSQALIIPDRWKP
ncbi:hypothetical protein [Pseudomonas putida]